jgi:hypothetical protein
MVQQRVHGRLATLHQVDHAGRQAGLLDQLNKASHGERDAVAWLEHKGVSSRDRVGQEPHGNHDRKVEGRDGGHNAQRLANHDLVDARRHIFK